MFVIMHFDFCRFSFWLKPDFLPITKITVDSVENNSFIQYYLNMFRPKELSSSWQEWKIKYTVFNGN